MPTQPYEFEWMPKLILSGSFDWGNDCWKGATLVDDPDVLKKTASSPVVAQWGEIKPVKNASLIHLIALGARETTGPNRNGDGFKAAFLRETHPTFKEYGALYRDHINKDFSKRDGEVIKTAYNEDMNRAELLVSADHEKCADWLPKVERDERVDFSMGFDCAYDVCEICHNKAKTKKEYCDDIKKLGMGKILPDGRKVCVDNPKGRFNDISKVGTGADMTAQSLRKAAGLDPFSELIIPTGAELAELAGFKTAEFAAKKALVEKMSRMEKLIPVSAFKADEPKKVEPKTAAKLRAADPSVMFGELAKIACVLDFGTFMRLLMDDRYSEVESYAKEASPHSRNVFSVVSDNTDTLNAVLANSTYDANIKAARVLSDMERVGFLADFSIEPAIATDRLMKRAFSGAQIDLADSKPLSDPARRLLEEYAAYKLAALAALDELVHPEHRDQYHALAVMSA